MAHQSEVSPGSEASPPARGRPGWVLRHEKFLRTVCVLGVYVLGTLCLVSVFALGTFAFISGLLAGIFLVLLLIVWALFRLRRSRR